VPILALVAITQVREYKTVDSCGSKWERVPDEARSDPGEPEIKGKREDLALKAERVEKDENYTFRRSRKGRPLKFGRPRELREERTATKRGLAKNRSEDAGKDCLAFFRRRWRVRKEFGSRSTGRRRRGVSIWKLSGRDWKKSNFFLITVSKRKLSTVHFIGALKIGESGEEKEQASPRTVPQTATGAQAEQALMDGRKVCKGSRQNGTETLGKCLAEGGGGGVKL